jgi:signal transduction histidine kinase
MDAWDRWSRVWHAAFHVVLVLTTALAVTDPGTSERGRVFAVLLAAALAGAHAAAVLSRGEWGRRTALKLSFVAAFAALWFLLAGIAPAYYVLLFVLYGQIYNLLPPRWAIPASVALTAVVTARSLVDSPASAVVPVLLQGLFWVVFGLFWAFWIYAIINQSRERKDLIEELEETRAELAAEERRAGTLEERGRLAREIHDTLAQDFVSIVTQLEAAETALPPGQAEARRLLDRARKTARGGLSESRRLVAALRPEILEGASLPEVLEGVADRWSEETGIEVSVWTTGEPRRLAPEAQVALLRAAQEALQNVRKHADAGRVDVTLSHVGDAVVLDVQDDGAGFDPGGGSTLVVELPVGARAGEPVS